MICKATDHFLRRDFLSGFESDAERGYARSSSAFWSFQSVFPMKLGEILMEKFGHARKSEI